jgi:hypothetical protein
MVLKDDATMCAEYKQQLINDVHPDNTGLEVGYSWLAHYTLKNARLGTLSEANNYYQKSLETANRRAELYGPHKTGTEPPVIKLVREQYAHTMTNPAAKKLPEDWDIAIATDRVEHLHIPGGFVALPNEAPNKKRIHSCLKCGKTALDIGIANLSKCSRCKKASYCSRECQKEDWKCKFVVVECLAERFKQ